MLTLTTVLQAATDSGSYGSGPLVGLLPTRATVPLWAFAVSVLALVLSAGAVYFQLVTHRAKKPVINIQISGLPPYASEDDRTKVVIQNVGTKATSRKVHVTVDCSWMPLISYRLNFPSEGYCLEPGEEHRWRLRLNEKLVPNSLVRVTVWDSNRDHWSAYEHLNSTTDVARTGGASDDSSEALTQ